MATNFTYNRQDASINPAALALPDSASGVVNTASIDLEAHENFLADCEFEISAPAMTVTMLPNADTATFSVQDSADDASFSEILDQVLVQLGAGSAGAVAQTKRFRVPTDVRRYVRVTCTLSNGCTDSSAVTFTLKAMF